MGVKMRRRQFNPIRDKVLEKLWADACCGEMSDDVTGGVGPLFHKMKDLVHLDDIALHTAYFIDAYQLAPAVRKALQLHDDRHGGSNLAANARYR